MAAAVTTTMLALLIAPIVYLHRREEKRWRGRNGDGWGCGVRLSAGAALGAGLI